MFLLKFNCYCYISGVPVPFFFPTVRKVISITPDSVKCFYAKLLKSRESQLLESEQRVQEDYDALTVQGRRATYNLVRRQPK